MNSKTPDYLKIDEKQEKEFQTLLMEAKARICVYGDSEVISSIANFWRIGAKLEYPEEKRAFLDMVKTMRKNSGVKNFSVNNEDISQLLMGVDLK